ncbi:MAG: hypothetical protein J0I42_14855 [Bosea sp.]|uniref:hypothetical protein n=1 Tax=Bosea sp. (in: a-proteobacteria) TaxID=1871050 RepID=UPI001AD17603|nr:hypothetical protein [Bosea sp. (in: a-proteobacteria)]MBN9453225.1 hypothetical protein [Bosea sp. (in: a-proteobacteria)]
MLGGKHRDQVFVAGGQPTVTYVDRQEAHVERNLARAIATPNQIVSLAGPTKTGKTVLCHKVLANREFVWIDGGRVKTVESLWSDIIGELRLPVEQTATEEVAHSGEAGVNAVVVSAKGSRLQKNSVAKKTITSMSDAIDTMIQAGIILVIDDFHYLEEDTRVSFLRNIKGAVFSGLKVLLLSVTHRAFDAIRSESELTGRFISVTLPNWSDSELLQIPERGFYELGADCPSSITARLAEESQASPFLMQKFCWEICFDSDIERSNLLSRHKIPGDFGLDEMFERLAKDAGLPIYQKLVAGPQSRKIRTKRPLARGGQADIYEATLLAIAETGPKQNISYDELRVTMNTLLTDMMPQKHEITSALKHLSSISMRGGASAAIDWDEDNRAINIVDPYLRFYLRWQVRGRT